MAVSHKQFVPAHSHSLKIQQMLLWSQQMLQHEESTLTESLLLFTLMFRRITRTTSTAQAVQLAPVNQVLL
jgi:hypothetical protein